MVPLLFVNELPFVFVESNPLPAFFLFMSPSFDEELLDEPFFRTLPAAGLFAGRVPLVEETKFRALLVDRHEILLLVLESLVPEFPV